MATGSSNPENGVESSVTRLTNQFRTDAEQRIGGVLNPLNWGWFGWLIAGVALFMGFTETGRGFFNNIVNWLTEHIPGLGGLLGRTGLVPEGVGNVLSSDPTGTNTAMGIIRENGGNIASLAGGDYSSVLTPEILFQMITRNGPWMVNMARAMATGSGTTNTANITAAMTAVRALVNDPAKLNTLMNAQNRGTTIALLEAVSPIRFPAGNLERFIREAGMNGDQVKPEMRQFLLGVLGTEQERNQAFTTFATTVDPAHIRNLLQGVDPAQIQNEQLRAMITQAQTLTADVGTARSLQNVQRQLSSQGRTLEQVQTQLLDPQGNLSIPNVVGALLNRQNRDLIRPNMDAVRNLAATEVNRQVTDPQTGQPTYAYPEDQRAMLNFLSTRSGGQPVNINAIMTMLDTVGGNTYNNSTPAAAQRTHTVITGMIGMLTGNDELTGTLNADNVSEFFRNPSNAVAFGTMLNNLNTTYLPPAMRTVVANLRAHWGNGTSGIVDILDNREAVQYMLDHRNDAPGGFVSSLPYGVQSFLGGIVGVPDDIRQNLEHLDVVRAALAAARAR